MKRFLVLIIVFTIVLISKSQNVKYSEDSLGIEIFKELLDIKENTSKSLFDTARCSKYKYFVKRKSLNGGYCLELKPITSKDSIARITYGPLIEDRDIFLGYAYLQKIEILKELLQFQGDTTKSGKSYKIMTSDLSRIYIEPFTIQIEALYTFSRMLLLGFPPFSPKLTDMNMCVNYNGCQTVVDEVYEIYKQWLEEAIDTDFKSINLPMSNSNYQWEGQQKVTKKWFINFHK